MTERTHSDVIVRACLSCETVFVSPAQRYGRAQPKTYCSTRCNQREAQRRYIQTSGAKARVSVYEAKRRERERVTGQYREERRRGKSRRRTLATARAKRAAKGTTGKKQLWAQGRCIRCSTLFLGVASGHIPSYCSDRCSRADKASRRRASESGAYVERVYRRRVFERDSWRCQLCRKLVKRDAVVPHPKAPVIDHILPLAVGGEHSMRNAQCAHFLCNSLKRDQATNDQLRLIG